MRIARAGKKLDRWRARGVQWWIVGTSKSGYPYLVDYVQAKTDGIKGELFKSKKEAERWLVLLDEERGGYIRNLRRQVPKALYAVRPDGIKEKVCDYVDDFEYERRHHDAWKIVVEDVKGFREDVYKLKAKWFAIQFGFPISEV